ncbi:MAG: hypothetical protein JWO38_6379 [Gemmataceae bacterium]|nr:hypothetical protein [Gemmataceae bacterium]
MGRVYQNRPDLVGKQVVVTDSTGVARTILAGVIRVEFSDETPDGFGIATVLVWLPSYRGAQMIDPDTKRGVQVTFKTWCRIEDIPAGGKSLVSFKRSDSWRR